MERHTALPVIGGLVAALLGLGTVQAQGQAGPIVAWGSNDHGQCSVPAPNADFIAVAGGCYHSLGLDADGSIAAWGANSYGQCDVPTPNADFIAVAGGYLHSLGLKVDGSIAAWGHNELGQCDVPAPNADFIAVAAGDVHSLGLKADGSIVAWGDNGYGQCDVPAPNTDFIAVAGGGGHSLGLKADGSVVAWGANDFGQCNVPAPNADFIAVAGGYYHSLGLRADGSVVAWGWNDLYQCNVPEPNADFTAVAGGYFHSLGLRADGSIVAWGDNGYGQCNVPEPNADFIAVAGGCGHSLGLGRPEPASACCFADGHCEFITEELCSTEGGDSQGYPSTCDPNPCPQYGACCSPISGRCTLVTEDRCTPPSIWMGEGTGCTPNPCNEPPGACCNPTTGDCTITTRAACVYNWHSEWTTCDPNPCPPGGSGSVYYVRADGSGESPPYFPTIQAALDYASSGDEIHLMNGTFTGPGNRGIDFRGKAVAVRSAGGPNECVIDAEYQARVFNFTSGEGPGSVLDGVTITHGGSWGDGAGIYINASSPTVRNSVIYDNHVYVNHGGGVFCGAGASPVFEYCEITQNGAGGYHDISGDGAGLYSDGSSRPTLRDCIVSANYAHRGFGAGIYCDDAVLIRCSIGGNNAGGGGGGAYCGHATLQNCAVTRNGAELGGGLYSESGAILNSCTIAGNASAGGGGIYGSGLQITDCVITGNAGGGVNCTSSSVTGCTISGNEGSAGGGLRAADTQLLRTIIWGNCCESGADEISSEGNVTLTCCAVNQAGVVGSVTYNGPQVYTDPQLCDPEVCEHAPTTAGDYELGPGSPCLPPVSPCEELIGALPGGCSPAGAPVDQDAQVPTTRAFPNPTRGPSTFEFSLLRGGRVSVDIYDVAGRLVRSVLDQILTQGVHSVVWDARDRHDGRVPAGVYQYVLRVDGQRMHGRIVILR